MFISSEMASFAASVFSALSGENVFLMTSSMGAITQRYSVPEAVLKALQAGADTALWITTKEVPEVLDRLQQAVDSGELPTERVDDAVRHMALTKDPSLACTR